MPYKTLIPIQLDRDGLMKIISLSLGIQEGHSVVATIWKMQATSVAPFSARCFPPNHNQLWGTIHHPQTSPHSSIKTKTKPTRTIILFSRGNQKCLATTSSLRREEKKKNKISGHVLLIEEMHYNKDQKRHSRSGISTNMWWQNLKGVLGQRLNLEGIVSSAAVVARERQLALPHLTVPDISWIDWAELQRRGFRGVIFDKDNTLTAPYSLSLWSPLAPSLDRCKSVFGDNIVVFSNSAGLYQYDADGSKAATLEKSLGIHVLRHGTKKPAGTAEEIEKYFGYTTSELVMVGDRHFTDIVYGNRNGFLTILTEPLSLAEEPFIVKQVRKLERCLVNHWYWRRIKPTDHILLLEAMQCVKYPSPL